MMSEPDYKWLGGNMYAKFKENTDIMIERHNENHSEKKELFEFSLNELKYLSEFNEEIEQYLIGLPLF